MLPLWPEGSRVSLADLPIVSSLFLLLVYIPLVVRPFWPKDPRYSILIVT